MKFIIFFVYIPFVYSESHSFMTSYTGITGQESIPEFFAVTILDGQQIDCYDSNTQLLVPKQDWMKELASKELWNEDTMIRQRVQQMYKLNIALLMQRFNQTSGVHTYQRMYGCEWDDETEYSHGFDQYGYDGEDYVTLDLKELRYITAVPQGVLTVMKWNNDRVQLDYLKQYYKYECVYWLKYFLELRKVPLESRAPVVSLLQKLQKDRSFPAVCHATGFYPSAVTITWLRNGHDHDEDVDLGEPLPNEDGTFQKTSSINVSPNNWKKDQYVCVVEHNSLTEPIQKSLTEDEIKRNKGPTDPFYIIAVCLMLVLYAVLFLFLFFYIAVRRKRKLCEQAVCQNEKPIYSDKRL